MKRNLLTATLLLVLAACSQEKAMEKGSVTPGTTTANVSKTASAVPITTSSSVPETDDGILGYELKLDVARLALALSKTEMKNAQHKEAEWNQRMAQAKNNADVQSVIAEQLALYRQAEETLQPVEMSSEQGKRIHGQMLGGFKGMREVLEKMQALDFDTPEALVQMQELAPRVKQHGHDLLASMQAWMTMMKENGFEPDATKEAEFNQKVQELEKKLK